MPTLGKHWKWSEESRKNKQGSNNPMWKGVNVGYDSIHEWIKNRLPKPGICSLCKLKPPYDLANKSGLYLRDLADWHWICRRCHVKIDGRMNNLKQYGGRATRV